MGELRQPVRVCARARRLGPQWGAARIQRLAASCPGEGGRAVPRSAGMPLPRYPATMSAPPSERQRRQHELAELLVKLGALRDEMEGLRAGPVSRFRRWWIARQAERLECRLVEVRARLAALPTDD